MHLHAFIARCMDNHHKCRNRQWQEQRSGRLARGVVDLGQHGLELHPELAHLQPSIVFNERFFGTSKILDFALVFLCMAPLLEPRWASVGKERKRAKAIQSARKTQRLTRETAKTELYKEGTKARWCWRCWWRRPTSLINSFRMNEASRKKQT